MRKLIPAIVAFLAAGASHALGFGELTLQSALNQPFDASVTLLAVKPSERDSVEVRIAEPETFERFGVARSAALDDIEVTVRPAEGNRLRIELRSRRPVREPFVTLLLVADWDGGRALREYTVLLDPPVEAPAARAESEPAPAPARDTAEARPGRTAETAEAAPEPREPARAEAEPAPRTAPPAAATESPGAEAPSYRRYGPVAPDETLWSIAYELRPDPAISMDQMLLAIYQSNPQAFEGNINRMRAGTMLIIPDAEEIRQIDRAVARQEIADQKRAYARSSAGTTTTARAEDDASRPQPAGEAPPGGGELRLEPPSDEVAEPAPEPETAAAAATDETADAGERIAENAAATARALADAAAADGATADGQAPAGETAVAGTAAGEAGDATPEEDAASTGTAAAPGAEGADTAPEAGETAAAGPETDVAGGGDAEGSGAAGATAGEPGQGVGGAEDATPAQEPAPVGAESVIPEGTAGLLTPRNLLLALGALLLAGLLAVWLRRRQYKPVPADFQAETIGQAGEPAGSAVPSLEDAERADEGLAATERSTVPELLADADSYIEHELYDEALAALEVGLEEHPDEPALRRKILEVQYYAGARDAFVDAAERHFPTPDEDDPDWRSVAAMGREIAPDEPRFAGVPAEASPARGPGGPEPETDAPLFEDDSGDAPEPGTDTRPDEDWQPETSMPPAPDESPDESEAHDASRQVDEGEFDLDFDFGLGDEPAARQEDERGHGDQPEPDAGEPREDTGTAPDASGEDRDTAGGGTADDAEGRDSATMPPSLDIDLSDFDLGGEESGGAPADEDETAPDKDEETADDGDEFADFDLDELSLDSDEAGDQTRPAEEGASGSETFGDLEEPGGPDESGGDDLELGEGFDLDDADLGREAPSSRDTPEEAESGGDETLSFEAEPEEVEAADESVTDDETGEEAAGASADADDDEVATQLDLARAYLDMGEPDMARSLLEEVKSKGNAEQRREAEELLGRVG